MHNRSGLNDLEPSVDFNSEIDDDSVDPATDVGVGGGADAPENPLWNLAQRSKDTGKGIRRLEHVTHNLEI